LGRRYLNAVGKHEALQKVLGTVRPLDEEEPVAVPLSRGRITSRPVYARRSNPPFTCAAMDGYAVAYERTVDADLGNPVELIQGSDAVQVNTGDRLPPGTNAIVIVEDVAESGDRLLIRKPVYLWQNVRLTGEDIIEGEALFPANYRLAMLDLGLLVAAGIREVYVKRKPRIVIVPTGRELVDIYEHPDRQVEETRLIDFNSYTLMAIGEDMGFQVTKAEIARDNAHLREILKEHTPTHDVVVINAGSSAGTEDFTEAIIQEFGTVLFHGVAMMPGKPTIFGVIDDKPVFGIPGYPVSAVISFETFLQPLYERLCGAHTAERTITCITPYKIPSSLGVEEVLRVRLIAKGDTYYAYPLPRGAGAFSSLSRADALIRIPENVEGYNADTEVRALLLRDEDELRNRINIVGSHDLSLDVLRDMVKERYPAMDLISAHVGSLSGIMAIQKGFVELATSHILDEREKVYNIPAARKYLEGKKFLLVHIAKRMQGLITAAGNPKGIRNVADLARKDVKFVNRQFGSGTRILLDMLLREHGIDARSIQGYEREEATHTACAILVKDGVADASLAIYPVSRVFSLDFIPIREEDYDLFVAEEFTDDPRFTMLMELLAAPEFAARLDEFGGYNTKESGKIKYVSG
jgi:putative molybdopterin biosynthesis protein